MAIRMGYWDCKSCGQKRIEGPERQCAACGQPRSASVQFYTDDDAKQIDDLELIRRATSGADWHCPYCSADNPAGRRDCVGCGASADGSKSREQKVQLDAPPPPPPPAKSAAPWKWIAIGLVALLFGAWALFFRTTDHAAKITAKAWEKSIVVERLETVRGEAWTDEVPGGARSLGTEMKAKTVRVQDGTERVKVGKKDLGNGFFEDVYEDKPRYVDKQVMSSWTRYELDRWTEDETLKSRSADGTEPPWPAFNGGPKRREGTKTSEIVLELEAEGGKRYRYSFDAERGDRGASYRVGDRYVAEVNALGAVRALKPAP